MPSGEILNVLDVRFAADRQPGCFEASYAQLELLCRHDYGSLAPQNLG